MDNKQYPNLIQWAQLASDEALRELSELTGMFLINSSDSTNDLHFWNGRRSIGLALLKLKEADVNTTLISQHKDSIRQWKTKQNLRKTQ